MQCGVIVGCGAMGKCHGEVYETMTNVTIAAVVDMDPVKGEALAKRLGCRLVKSLDELGTSQIDFVDICLPTHLHMPMIRQAAAFTKKIICEKPLAVKEEEVKEIEDLVKEKGIHLMVAHVLRFWDTYVLANEKIQENVLGKVNSISCTRRQKRPGWASNNWLSNVSLSGGLIFDLMIHDIDWIVWHMGKPCAVMGNIVSAPDGTPAHAKAQLQYENCTVDLFASWGMPKAFAGGSTLEVIGTEGMLACNLDGQVTITDATGTRAVSVERRDAYREELVYFVDCCEKNKYPDKCDVISVADSLEVARAIHVSVSEGNVINLK